MIPLGVRLVRLNSRRFAWTSPEQQAHCTATAWQPRRPLIGVDSATLWSVVVVETAGCDGFPRCYNAAGFATNRYDEKLAAAHTSLSNKGLPDLEARAVQLLLTYHGFNRQDRWGRWGLTRAAIAESSLPTSAKSRPMSCARISG